MSENNIILAENIFYDSSKKYVMGVDSYDGKNFAACVMSKDIKGETVVVYIGKGNNKEDFEKEVNTIAAYFNIQKENIFKEQD